MTEVACAFDKSAGRLHSSPHLMCGRNHRLQATTKHLHPLGCRLQTQQPDLNLECNLFTADRKTVSTPPHLFAKIPFEIFVKSSSRPNNASPKVKFSVTLPRSLGRTPVDGVGSNLHQHQCSWCPLGWVPQLTLPNLRSGQTLELGVSTVSVGHFVTPKPLCAPPHTEFCRERIKRAI